MAKEIIEAETAKITLRDLLCSNIKVRAGDIEIANGCNETLLCLTSLDEYVASLDKILKDELLNRQVIQVDTNSMAEMRIIIEGVEDAE